MNLFRVCGECKVTLSMLNLFRSLVNYYIHICPYKKLSEFDILDCFSILQMRAKKGDEEYHRTAYIQVKAPQILKNP